MHRIAGRRRIKRHQFDPFDWLIHQPASNVPFKRKQTLIKFSIFSGFPNINFRNSLFGTTTSAQSHWGNSKVVENLNLNLNTGNVWFFFNLFYQGNKGEAKTKANEATCFLKDISDTNWSDLVATCVPHKRYCCHLLVPLYQCVVRVPCKNFHHRNVVPSIPEHCLPHLAHTMKITSNDYLPHDLPRPILRLTLMSN